MYYRLIKCIMLYIDIMQKNKIIYICKKTKKVFMIFSRILIY